MGRAELVNTGRAEEKGPAKQTKGLQGEKESQESVTKDKGADNFQEEN